MESAPYSSCTWTLKFVGSHHLDRPPDRATQLPRQHQFYPADFKLKVSCMATLYTCCRTNLTKNLLVEDASEVCSIESSKLVPQRVFDQDAYIGNGSTQGLDRGWEMLTLQRALSCLEESRLLLPSFETFICILVKCTEMKNLAYGFRVHAFICLHGLDPFTTIVGYLISMWVAAGSVTHARKVFDRQDPKTASLWNLLIKGYINENDVRHAIKLYQNMLDDSLHPDEPTWVALLRACATLKDAHTGSKIHAEITINRSLYAFLFVGSSLVDMYCKCGFLGKAQEVLDMLPDRDVVTWTALIGGCVQLEQGAEALACFERMQLEGVSPNAHTFACILKACGSLGAIDRGKEIHGEVEKLGLLRSNLIVGNALIDMYARCGFPERAQEVFDTLPTRDVVSWTTLITGYTNQEKCKEALNCFNQMQSKGVRADAVTYSCILKACGTIKALHKGREIHAQIADEGWLKRCTSLSICNALIDMYAKCNVLEEAQKVFDNLVVRNVISWNALIGGYVLQDCCEEAVKCYRTMQSQNMAPNAITNVCILRACGRLGDTNLGNEIHTEIARNGTLPKDISLGNALIDMYGKLGCLGKAQEVFDKLLLGNIVSWNTLIAANVQHECNEEAVHCLDRMQREHVLPDDFSFASSLKACGSLKLVDKGREVHCVIIKRGLLENNLILGNALIDLYAKCGSLAEAQEVFNKLSAPDVITWTTLILSYVDNQHDEEALRVFRRMQSANVSPNSVTLACILKACGSIEGRDVGREVHVEIARRKLLEEDSILGSVLIGMYVENRSLTEAHEVFDKLPVCDVVSWTTLIAGYDKHELSEEALSLFKQMQLEGVTPSALTFNCSLNVCGNAGALTIGRAIHNEIETKGLLRDNLVLGTALVDMYAKCGQLEEAMAVFDALPAEDTVLWNTLMTGFAQVGDIESVFDLYETIREGSEPDTVTFLNILNACSHVGLVGEAQVYFKTMCETFGITPTLEHYTCLVDIFGRAGQVDRAVSVLTITPFSLNVTMWLALLGACRKWFNGELGGLAFNQAATLGGFDAAVYICMRNIYSDMNIEDGSLLVDDAVC